MIPLLTRAPAALLLLVSLLHLAGCERQAAIRVYDAPKDPTSPVEWTIPSGWREVTPQAMQFAAFVVSADHPEAAVTVVPLPFSPEQLLSNVNRWEGQVGLPPTPPEEIQKVVKTLADAKVSMGLVDLVGKDSKDGSPRRIIAAIAQRSGDGWFFKLSGPPDVVQEQKAAFETFLRSVEFKGKGPPPPSVAGSDSAPDAAPPGPNLSGGTSTDPHQSATATSSRLEWDTLPTGWVVDPSPHQFRNYSFKVSGAGGEGEFAVTRMPQQTAGPLLDNINRWRKDVGLPAVTEASGMKPTQLELGGQPGFSFDITGSERRMIIAMTSSGPDFWFFKFTGPLALVEGQKDSFATFLKSVRFVGDAR